MEILRTEVIEDGAKRDRQGRRILPPEQIEALVREYRASGLTQAAFARREGLKYPTFAGWVNARRVQAGRASGGSAVRFAQLQLPTGLTAPTELSVALPDGVVVRGSEVRALAALVRALRGEPC
jgi:transposase-like protein